MINRRTLSLLLVAPALLAAAGCAYQDPMSRGGDVYGTTQRVPGNYGYGAPYPPGSYYPGGYYYDPRYGYYTSYRSYPYGYGYYPYGYAPPVNYCRDADRDGRCDTAAGGGGGDGVQPPPRNPTLREVREEVRRQREAAQPPAQVQPAPTQHAVPLERARAQAEPQRRPIVRRGEGRTRPAEEIQSQEP